VGRAKRARLEPGRQQATVRTSRFDVANYFALLAEMNPAVTVSPIVRYYLSDARGYPPIDDLPHAA